MEALKEEIKFGPKSGRGDVVLQIDVNACNNYFSHKLLKADLTKSRMKVALVSFEIPIELQSRKYPMIDPMQWPVLVLLFQQLFNVQCIDT